MLSKKELVKLIEKTTEFGLLQTIDRKLNRPGGDRPESTAEHSWQLAMMAWLFLPHYEEKLDLEKVLKLALLHDAVEIYAGDTFAFDLEHKKTKHARENAAAEKLFIDQPEMGKLWKEYALRQSKEALYVAGLDKLIPEIRHGEGGTIPIWKGKLTVKDNRAYKEPQLKHSQLLMAMAKLTIGRLKDLGYFEEEK